MPFCFLVDVLVYRTHDRTEPRRVIRLETGIQMEGVLLTFSSLHGEAAGLSRPDRPAPQSPRWAWKDSCGMTWIYLSVSLTVRCLIILLCGHLVQREEVTSIQILGLIIPCFGRDQSIIIFTSYFHSQNCCKSHFKKSVIKPSISQRLTLKKKRRRRKHVILHFNLGNKFRVSVRHKSAQWLACPITKSLLV